MYKVFFALCCISVFLSTEAMKREYEDEKIQAKRVKRENSSDKALLETAQRGDCIEVLRLLEKGAAIEVSDDKGRTALLLAAKKGHKELVRLLIAHGAHVNAQDTYGWTALIYAVRSMVKYCAKGVYKEVINILIEQKADVNIQAHSDGQTAVLFAMWDGDEEITKILLKAGALVNVEDRNGESPLRIATRYGFKKVVKLLLAHGADVNAQSSKGDPALMEAASYSLKEHDILKGGDKGFEELAELLIAAGANVNAQDEFGTSALELAVRHGHQQVAKILITRGARVDIQDKNGRSALMVAASKGSRQMAEMLIEAGADVNMRDNSASMETALMQASDPEVVALLLKHSAKFTRDDMNRVPRFGALPAESRLLLNACYSLPVLDLYRSEPVSYAQWHREHCFEKSKYIRLCQVNPSTHYLLQKETGDHTHCFHMTVLMWASMLGHKEALEQLLRVDIPLWYLNAQDPQGRTALIYAIMYGHKDAVQLLAQAYERKIKDISTLLKQETNPVKQAALKQELEKAERAINICDAEGKSALAYALKKENKELAHRLIQAGARPGIDLIKKIAQTDDNAILLQLIVKGFIVSKEKTA